MISEKFDLVGNQLVVREGVLEIDHTSLYQVISEASFEVEEVVLPESLVVICDRAFFDVPGIRRIHLPIGLQRIGAEAFWGMDDLEELDIPEGVSVIGKHAFCNCCQLKLHIPFDEQRVPFGWDDEFSCNIKEICFKVK